MLFLPLEEDSLLFQVCLYYGLVVLALQLVVPTFFHRRVRVELPRLQLHAPVTPLSTREFKRRQLALQQQITALQQTITATPRRTPEKKRQISIARLAKKCSAASPSPFSSPCQSPTQSIEEVVLMHSPTQSIEEVVLMHSPAASSDDEEVHEERKRPEENKGGKRREEPMSPGSPPFPVGLRRPVTAVANDSESHIPRPYNLPVGVLREPRHDERQYRHQQIEQVQEDQQEKDHSDELECEERPKQSQESIAYASTGREKQLPTLSSRISLDRDSDGSLGTSYSGASEAAMRLEALIASRRRRNMSFPMSQPPISLPPTIAAGVSTENAARQPSSAPQSQSHTQPLSPVQEEGREGPVMEKEDEEKKESEQVGKSSSFQAFCASFAAGDTTAARQFAEKRKHHEAFEKDEERPREKTPRIVRKITFEDEVDGLSDTPSKEQPHLQSNGKRNHQQAFGTIEEVEDEDSDAEWRESLAFRPRD